MEDDVASRHQFDRARAEIADSPPQHLRDYPFASLDSIIFSQSVDPMLLVASSGTILEANAAMGTLFGIARSALVGRPLGEVIQPSAGPVAVEADREADATREPRQARILDHTGHGRDVSVNSSLLRLGDDAPPLRLVVLRVLAPTASAPRLTEEVFSMLSHALRTPLTSIKGCASTLLLQRQAHTAERVRDFVAIIDEQADRLRDMIDNLPQLAGIALQPARQETKAAAALAPPSHQVTPSTTRVIAGKPRVLIVDDDSRMLRLVRSNLEGEGYEVRTVQDGESALDCVEAEQPDLILLDLMLGQMDGFEVCQRIREFSTVPIIVLTAKGGGNDRIRALDLGADDYMTKPFETAELLARVRAGLRRSSFAAEATEARPLFCCGDVEVDFARRRVVVRGREVPMSRTEYKLLYQLVTKAGRVLVHEDLLSKVWGPEYREEIEYLRSYIRHLRRKIEEDNAHPHYILTQPGVGYLFRSPK